jgi:hypothetical protein
MMNRLLTLSRLTLGIIALSLFSQTAHSQDIAQYAGLSMADSIETTDRLLAQFDDSLNVSLARFQTLFEKVQSQNTDSLKHAVHAGEGRVWFDWAVGTNPRYGMNGEQWLGLSDLFAWLDQFEFVGAYDKQLNCLKWAAVYPDTEFLAMTRLHTEYHLAGFSPGIISTGERLMQLNEKRSFEAGIARNIAQAWYFVGDFEQALSWMKKHIAEHPEDKRARDLRKEIRRRSKEE